MAAKNSTRNPLIGDDTAETARNIACVVSFLRTADSHIAGVSELGEFTIEGRSRIMDCIQSAAESLATVGPTVKTRERKKRGTDTTGTAEGVGQQSTP